MALIKIEKEIERTEEGKDVCTRYYCHHCDQVVTEPVDVNVTCPLRQSCFIEECGGVSPLHLAMSSTKSEGTSASNSHGFSTMAIPPDQTILDIVEDDNGSAISRWSFHNRFQDYENYDVIHIVQLGHDDNRSLLFGDGSDAFTSNSVPGQLVPYVSSSNTVLLPLNISTTPTSFGQGQPHHEARAPSSMIWIYSVGFFLEASTACFDQVATPQKPQHAFYGMLLSIGAVLFCVLDLISNVIEQRRVASESDIRWGVLPEVFGLALACIQCINSTMQFSFLCRHVAYPLKVSPAPLLLFFALFVFKYRYGRNSRFRTS